MFSPLKFAILGYYIAA